MLTNTKQNDLLVEKFGDYAHLYAWLEPVERTDEEGTVTTEYQGPLTVMQTTLTLDELAEYREDLIKFAPAASTSEAAQRYMDDNDYIHSKCAEEHLDVFAEYPDVIVLKKRAREIKHIEKTRI